MDDLAKKVVESLKLANKKVVFAESLTGGLIAEQLVSVPGASAVFEYGFITYSDEAKINILGVDKACIAQFGAVSSQCALMMAEGALRLSDADIAVSVTGFAGPASGDEYEPVGCVYIGFDNRGQLSFERKLFNGSRQEIREMTVKSVFEKIINEL